MSVTENTLQINNIKTDLALKIKFSEMDNTQKRSVIDQLFPDGVAMYYTDPKIAIDDWVFGVGNANINGGGFFFGKALDAPIVNDADVDQEIQL